MRGQSFTPPRTITLDTKYEGAVSVNIWTGYAVMVTSKTGARRVVEGPENVLLEYDETLAPLELSTGKPKTHDKAKLLKTVYLRVTNNVVSDIITLETKDLIKVNVTVAYRVNFEGDDKISWFAVENYVQLLTEHMRSLIRNAVKRLGIEEFYGSPIDLVRDAALGAASTPGGIRPGRAFAENNMRVYDVEVMDVRIMDESVSLLLMAAQKSAINLAVQLADKERHLAATRRSEEITRETATLAAETAELVGEQKQRETTATVAQIMAQLNGKLIEAERRNAIHVTELDHIRATDAQAMETKKAQIEADIVWFKAETEELVKRANAVSDKVASAILTMSDQAMVSQISKDLAPMAAMTGLSAADVLAKLFEGTPFKGVMEQLSARIRPQLSE